MLEFAEYPTLSGPRGDPEPERFPASSGIARPSKRRSNETYGDIIAGLGATAQIVMSAKVAHRDPTAFLLPS